MAATLEGAQGPSFAREAPELTPAPGRIWLQVDRFLAPQADRFSADELRRARLAIVVCATIAPLAAVSTTNVVLNGVWKNVPFTTGVLILTALVPFLIRLSGSLAIAGNAIALVVSVGLTGLMFNTGASTTPPFILLPGVPLVATLIAGPRAGVFWSGVALFELGGFYWLTHNGLEPTVELDPAFLQRGRFVGSANMVLFALGVATAYERLKTRALDEMEAAHRLAETRSQELGDARRQQLEMKDRFLSHVSHELRTPLAALHQYLSLTLDGLAGTLAPVQRDYLSIAFRNAEQLSAMIDDLMDLNRARSGKLRVDSDLLSAGPLVIDIVQGLVARADEKGVRLEADIQEELPMVQGDPVRTRQVLGNLIENAIKFTPEGGRIQVHAEPDPEDETFLCIAVSDTGCGIEAGSVEHIFERLHQESESEADSRLGLGLGLAIAKELVERQRGRIWAESAQGRGSTFRFTLPIFSLSRALRPCVVEEGRFRRSFSVVRVEPRGPNADAWDGMRRGVQHLIRTTVFYPEKDVVLPCGAVGEPEERFSILAATGATGVQALVKRLRLRLDRHAEERGQDPKFFHIAASTQEIPDLSQLPESEALEIVAGRLEEILRASGAGETTWPASRS